MKKKSIELSDVNRELQKVISSGKIRMGSRQTLKALTRSGEGPKIVIYATNCPDKIKNEFEEMVKKENAIYEYPTNSLELGLACGKLYPIASLCILDTGESELLRLLSHNFQSKKKTLIKDAGDRN